MGLMSFKDYAERCKVSYEAVRHQVAHYKDALGEHIIKDGRQNFLDDFAVAFLDDHRAKNPVVIYQASKDEEIERLKLENERHLKKITEQAEEITALYRWKSDNAMAIAEATQTKLLLENTQNKLQKQAEELEKKEERLKLAEDELAAYKALPWYQRIKKHW